MDGKKIAIIPARGGSKRVPGKNVREFFGRPIIQYSIEAALESNCFQEVMVSTDNEEIAEIAIKCGAQVPFLRSPKNADDFATIADVMFEVLDKYAEMGQTFDFFCGIYSTAPFVTPEKIRSALQLLQNSNSDGLLPVVPVSFPIFRFLKIEKEKLEMFWPEYTNTRSQDIPTAYQDSGQFFMMRTERFYEKKKILTGDLIPLILKEWEAQDIDSEEDWKMAELKYTLMKSLAVNS